MQNRHLLESMKYLFISFKKENSDEICLYSYLTKHKPFYIKPPAVDGRDTCQCKMHINIKCMLNVLYSKKIISESNMTQGIEKPVCATDNGLWMTSRCSSHNKKQIIYITQNQSQLLKWQQCFRRFEIIDNGKYFEEMQSHHFCRLRKQITFHVGVFYITLPGENKAQVSSFCSVLPNNSYNPAAI